MPLHGWNMKHLMEEQDESVISDGTVIGHCYRHYLDVLEPQSRLAIIAFNGNLFSRDKISIRQTVPCGEIRDYLSRVDSNADSPVGEY